MGPLQPSILVFGEILWDVAESGECIGGAAFNFAAHAVRCGLKANLYSKIGKDLRGSKARVELKRAGVDDQWVQEDEKFPTGRVDVSLDAHGQPSYSIASDTAWDDINPPSGDDLSAMRNKNVQALVFGTLAQRSARSAKALQKLRENFRGIKLFYDVNLRSEYTPLSIVKSSLPEVDIVKMGDSERDIISKDLYGKTMSDEDLFARFQTEFGTQIVITTKGERGCEVTSSEGLIQVPTESVKVVSAVGAGDAFGAAFLSSLLRGGTLEVAAGNANHLGAWVASRMGAVPAYEEEAYIKLIF